MRRLLLADVVGVLPVGRLGDVASLMGAMLRAGGAQVRMQGGRQVRVLQAQGNEERESAGTGTGVRQYRINMFRLTAGLALHEGGGLNIFLPNLHHAVMPMLFNFNPCFIPLASCHARTSSRIMC